MVRCQMVLLDSSAKDRISSTLYVYHIAFEMIKCMCWWCRWDVRLSLNILSYPNIQSSLSLKRHLLRKLVYLVVVLQLVMELWPRLPELMVSFLSISLLYLLCRLGFSTRETVIYNRRQGAEARWRQVQRRCWRWIDTRPPGWLAENSTVAVFGIGCVGLSILQGARAKGCKRVFAIDTNPTKEEWAKKFGASTSLYDHNEFDT